MLQIPAFMLKQLYVAGSLRNTGGGFRFVVTNPFLDGTVTGVHKVAIDGVVYDLATIRAAGWDAAGITPENPVNFPRGAELAIEVMADPLPAGRRNLYVKVETVEFGPLKVDVYDRIS